MNKLESRALALCLARLAGADVYSPYTREHGLESALWRRYEGWLNQPGLARNIVKLLREGFEPETAVLLAHSRGEWLAWGLCAERFAAARILSANGLAIPEFLADCRDWVEYLEGKG